MLPSSYGRGWEQHRGLRAIVSVHFFFITGVFVDVVVMALCKGCVAVVTSCTMPRNCLISIYFNGL